MNDLILYWNGLIRGRNIELYNSMGRKPFVTLIVLTNHSVNNIFHLFKYHKYAIKYYSSWKCRCQTIILNKIGKIIKLI